ncbi:hypothetical protein SAHY_17429 [Salinisphaera hydrothermalis EPR70]
MGEPLHRVASTAESAMVGSDSFEISMAWAMTFEISATRWLVVGALVAGLMAGCSSPQHGSSTARSTNSASSTHTTDHPTPAASSTQSAADVLAQYFKAIDAGQFDQAYALWRTQSHQAPASAAALKSQYPGVSSIRMKVTGNTRTEGAAGTIYATVPITVTEHTRDGTDKSRTGQCVLARSNNVPGSSDKARHWHLHSCDLS